MAEDLDLTPFQEKFDELDTDNDGKLSHSDLKKAMTSAGMQPSDDDIAAIIQLADVEGTGSISFEEFCRVIVGAQFIKLRIAARLYAVFSVLDADGSGYITKDNLKTVVKDAGVEDKIPAARIDEMMSKADQTGDGKISFEEFVGAVIAFIQENAE